MVIVHGRHTFRKTKYSRRPQEGIYVYVRMPLAEDVRVRRCAAFYIPLCRCETPPPPHTHTSRTRSLAHSKTIEMLPSCYWLQA